VLMDIKLQGEMDGIQTAHALRSLLDIPVVYLTSYSDQNTIERAKVTEPFGYLLKPFKEKELLATIEMAVYKHEADANLKRHRELLATILRSIGDGVIAIDREGRVQFMNAAAERLTGWTEGEASAKPLGDVFDLRDASSGNPVPDPEQPMLRDGTAGEIPDNVLLRSRDGREFAIDDSAAPIKDSKGNTLGLVLAFRDISDKKLLQQELIHSEKLAALGQLISGVAHELNNPLTSVIGFTDLLLGSTECGEGLKERLQIIRSEGDRARKIVRNLLSFARSHHPHRTEVNLNALIQTTIDLRSYEMSVSNVSLRFELSDIPAVVADAHQLQQVLLNLVMNAEQAIADSGKPGEIVVATEERKIEGQRAVAITITDTGPGIPQANLDRIFDPFFTTKPVGKGTGLGLSVSYGIIKEHQGNIRVENRPEGGARFTIELRVSNAISQA
ncbi:MAG TPA: ATP-binding protein, partial [Blastocatellia bacterium]|nr:ATP-binding protein [Blastocatellia bacterium]